MRLFDFYPMSLDCWHFYAKFSVAQLYVYIPSIDPSNGQKPILSDMTIFLAKDLLYDCYEGDSHDWYEGYSFHSMHYILFGKYIAIYPLCNIIVETLKL